MKKQSITLFLSIFVVSIINAQDNFFLEEQLIQLEDTRFSAWVFPVAHDLDFALKEYIMLGEKLSIPGISTKRGDLIGKGFITETYYSVALIFKLGYDISLNSVIWEQEMKNFRSYAREFMSYHFEKAFARRIDGVEKQISDLDKEKKQALNKIDSDNKKIQSLDKKISKETDETKIAESKTEISVLEDNIAGLTNTTTQLQDQIDSLKEDELDINAELHTVQENIGSL